MTCLTNLDEATRIGRDRALAMLKILTERLVAAHPPDGPRSEKLEPLKDTPPGVIEWWIHGEGCGGFCDYACGAICMSGVRDDDGDITINEITYGTLTLRFPT